MLMDSLWFSLAFRWLSYGTSLGNFRGGGTDGGGEGAAGGGAPRLARTLIALRIFLPP
jgi:hypothetical protein